MTIPRNLSFLAQGASSTGVLSVPYGGTGLTTLTAGYIPYGNGTGAFSNTSLFTYATNRLTATNSIFANGGMTLGRDSSSGGVYNTLDFVEGVTTTGYLRNYGSVYGSGLNYATELWNSQNGIIRFGTNNTEQMRLFPSGGVSIGNTTDPGATNLSVQGKIGVGTATPANSLNIVADNTPFRGQLSLQTVSASNLNQFSWYNQTVESATIYQDYSDNSWNFINIQPAPITFFTANTERMRLFPSGGFSIGNTTDPGATNLSVTGNLGLGVTPSAWSTNRAIQVGLGASLIGNTINNTTDIGNNIYGNFSYLTTGAASFYRQFQGTHSWFSMPSGTAGNSVSTYNQNMTLFASGGVSIGNTTDAGAGNLSVTGSTYSVTTTNNVTFGTPVTVYSFPNLGSGGDSSYMVTAGSNRGDATNFSAYAIIMTDAGTSRIMASTLSVGVSISMSGLDLIITNNAGSTIAVKTNILKLM